MITDILRPRPDRPTDLLHLLLECHDRIRTFLALARAIAERVDAPPAQVVDACHRVERYFSQALPLHLRDEEESLLPRLVGRSAELDEAIREVEEQHGDHEPQVEALLQALVAVREVPDSRAERARLAAATMDLSRTLLTHLTLEEASIFRWIRCSLSPDTQARIIRELRERRGVMDSPLRRSTRADRPTLRIVPVS